MQRMKHEGGFALPAALLLLVMVGIITAAVFAAVNGDLPIAKADQQRRSALDAAQAGSSWYAAKLAADPDYWTTCMNVPDPDGGTAQPPVYDRAWNGTSPLSDPRKFRTIPGTNEEYTIELLPANGKPACDPAAPGASMLSGNKLRIRSTGRVGGLGGKKRSIITTFRRPSFLDYVYYTNYEALDWEADANPSTTADNCKRYWNGSPPRSTQSCGEIQWTTGDVIAGPLHTNDVLNVCGTPVFGRTKGDRIETSDAAGSRTSCGNDGATYNGLQVKGIEKVTRPPNNQSLSLLTQSGYTFSGSTQFILGATSFQYRNASNYPRFDTKPYPPDGSGLLYVTAGSGTCPASTIYQKYDYADLACGNAYVSGTYGKDVTVAASNDIIVVDDLKSSNQSSSTGPMAGLVANNYVRLFHPVDFDTSGNCSAASTNSTVIPKYMGYDVLQRGALPWRDPVVQAGILAVNHSWIVDNYPCAPSLGTLSVAGAIAQEFRGPVATSNGSSGALTTGYKKNYSYDDRFGYRQPPNFLDPVRAAWILVRQNEQQPAT